MTSRRPYCCSKKTKRRPRWCSKPILWELTLFLYYHFIFFQQIGVDARHVSENALWEIVNASKEKPTDHFKWRWFQQNKMRMTQIPRLFLQNQLALIKIWKMFPISSIGYRQKNGRQLRSSGDEVEERNLTSTEKCMFLKNELFQMNNETIIGFGFRMICKIMQIS